MLLLKAIKNLFTQRRSARVLLRASILYRQAVDEAEEAYRRTGHRYYVVYDPMQRKLIPLTYDFYAGHADSYVYLRRRGRFGNPLTRKELKEKCFYYTPSRNFPSRRCAADERRKKLLRWQRYYSLCLDGRR